MGVSMILVSILSFPFDGGFLGHVLALILSIEILHHDRITLDIMNSLLGLVPQEAKPFSGSFKNFPVWVDPLVL